MVVVEKEPEKDLRNNRGPSPLFTEGMCQKKKKTQVPFTIMVGSLFSETVYTNHLEPKGTIGVV